MHMPRETPGSLLRLRAEGWVDRARAAQREWRALRLSARLRRVRRFRQALARDGERLGEAVAAGRNKSGSVAEAIAGEVMPLGDACRFLELRAGRILAPRRSGWIRSWLMPLSPRCEIRHEPFGVILVLAPSNYPLMLPGIQAMQAVAAGNAVLWKPGSGGTPAAVAFLELLRDAGFPTDLVQVLPESPEAGTAALAAGVDKVILTGSERTGRIVAGEAAAQMIPTVMELSGCDPMVVLEGADPGLAARALVFGLRWNAGETCIAPRRVLVSEAIHGRFIAALRAELARVPSCEFAVPAALEARIRVALGAGAELIHGSVDAGGMGMAKGPVVIDGAHPSALDMDAEAFAPVAFVSRVCSDAEAIRLADAPGAGLGGSVFAKNGREGMAAAKAISASVVTVNDVVVPTAHPSIPFGGRGRSGFGLTRGAEGLLEMTRTKSVTVSRGGWRPHYAGADAVPMPCLLAALAVKHGTWRTKLQALARAVGCVSSGLRKRTRSSPAILAGVFSTKVSKCKEATRATISVSSAAD